MNEHEIDRIASAFHVLRPDWPHASLRTFIAKNLADRPRRDVAVALAWISCESNTATPARVLENGPWWKAANAESSGTTTAHTGRTVGLRDGDPRDICGICDMWRADCDQRKATSGHEFVARSECMPPTEVGALGQKGRCFAGPVSNPCRLKTGHDGPHDCPPNPVAEPVAQLRALADTYSPPAYLDARRDLTTHPRNESAATEEDDRG